VVFILFHLLHSAQTNNYLCLLQRNTLILYLLDELHYYEDGHADALRPIQRELDRSFLGEHRDLQPVTLGDMRGVIKGMEHTINTAIWSAQGLVSLHSTAPPTNITRAGEHSGSNLTVRMFQPNQPTPPSLLGRSSESGLLLTGALPPGLCIPKRSEVDKADRWKAYVRDWEEADPARGLTVALKDWPKDWYTGKQRVQFATLRSTRALIAEEFING
jgi:hypothetical protein